MYLQMLPDQLSDSIVQNGGLGLARTLYDAMKDREQ
jgi:Rod binding domain-containing protein